MQISINREFFNIFIGIVRRIKYILYYRFTETYTQNEMKLIRKQNLREENITRKRENKE